ncbi:hypothetical protein PHLCEN_2v5954 [Hermanssonia centrifuga]|uniref:Uncharacterized protein n=1 Tax=Hermanssonia centrifuga TaxID=98765 RepID=A0A2R6P105_9APHY|nr:hypothetical protein PHLCEN_2v5954 [Hermanssonia centrifuga]
MAAPSAQDLIVIADKRAVTTAAGKHRSRRDVIQSCVDLERFSALFNKRL